MKKIIAILIAVVVVSSMSVIAIHAVSSDNIELPETDTTVAEATEATETEPVTTEAVVTEPEVMEAEVTEPEPEIPEEIRGILGTFYCNNYWLRTSKGFTYHPEYIPAISFNADGTIVFRVYYFGGVTTVDGTYDVADNKINIKLDIENSFFKGGYECSCTNHPGSLHPYMDDEYVFEIVDNDNLIFHGAENCVKGNCYVVYDGDAFAREQWWLNEEAE